MGDAQLGLHGRLRRSPRLPIQVQARPVRHRGHRLLGSRDLLRSTRRLHRSRPLPPLDQSPYEISRPIVETIHCSENISLFREYVIVQRKLLCSVKTSLFREYVIRINICFPKVPKGFSSVNTTKSREGKL